MAGGTNLASKYSKTIDERFHKESQAVLALSNDYKFTGVKTVNVYSIPIVPMTDYSRSGTSRYGTANDLSRNVQTLTVSKDRAFTFLIDRGDNLQDEMVTDAGLALARQVAEVWVPEFDSYVFQKLADAAVRNGSYAASPVTTSNAYEMFLAGMEVLGDRNVPERGRVCFCTYNFANLLKRDAAFVRYGDAAQSMLAKGVIGEVDGCKIVKVPSGRMPAGAAFLLTHATAATAPKQLEEFKIHDNPPGISGWLVEGRVIYDCFVLNEKAHAIYYHGGQSILKHLTVGTAGTAAGKSTIVLSSPLSKSSNLLYYKTGNAAAPVTYDITISGSTGTDTDSTLYGWTAFSNGAEITPAAGHTLIQTVEVDAAKKKVLAVGQAVLNIGT